MSTLIVSGVSSTPREAVTTGPNGCHLAPDDQLAFVKIAHTAFAEPVDGRRVIGKLEQCFHGGLRLSCADERTIGALARHESQRIDEDRLARARLTREQIKAGPEFDRQVLDDHQIPDS